MSLMGKAHLVNSNALVTQGHILEQPFKYTSIQTEKVLKVFKGGKDCQPLVMILAKSFLMRNTDFQASSVHAWHTVSTFQGRRGVLIPNTKVSSNNGFEP